MPIGSRNSDLRAIWGIARKLGLSQEAVRLMADGMFGKDSLRTLTDNQMKSLRTKLMNMQQDAEKQERKRVRTQARRGRALYFPSPEQKETVANILKDIAVEKNLRNPDAYLDAMCRKTWGRSYEKMDGLQIQSLIEALKSIRSRFRLKETQ